MEWVDKVILVIILLTALIALCGGAFIWYELIYKSKRSRLENDEDVDYTKYDRADTMSYLSDFDDIFSDMIICNDYTRFVGAVRVVANDDYANTRAQDRVNIRDGYVNFVSAINGPITYRQYSEGLDLENVLKRYIEAHDKIEEELYLKTDEFNRAVMAVNEYNEMSAQEDNIESYDSNLHEQLYKRVIALNDEVSALDWRRSHIAEEINYIKGLSNSGVTERVETYLFEWTFDSMDYDYQLSTQEIIKKAIDGLADKERSLSRMLSSAGVSVYRVGTKELIGMMRHNFCPTRSASFKLSDIEKSNMLDTVTTTNTLGEMDAAMAEELQLLDYLEYKAENTPEEVDEEYVVYDVPELFYEGSAVELGETDKSAILAETAATAEAEEEEIEDTVKEAVEQENAETEDTVEISEELLKNGNLRGVKLATRSFEKTNVSMNDTDEDEVAAVMANLNKLISGDL